MVDILHGVPCRETFSPFTQRKARIYRAHVGGAPRGVSSKDSLVRRRLDGDQQARSKIGARAERCPNLLLHNRRNESPPPLSLFYPPTTAAPSLYKTP